LLRREGLYSSHIVEWRRACDNAAKAGLASPQRAKANPDSAALAKANKRIRWLEADLEKYRLAPGQQDPQVQPGVPGSLRVHPRHPHVPRRLLHLTDAAGTPLSATSVPPTTNSSTNSPPLKRHN
jgi:hypothetical protein